MLSKPDLIISGTKSGLGKYLNESLGGFSWNRNDGPEGLKNREEIKSLGTNIIIHCAASKNRRSNKYLAQVISDDVALTSTLLLVPHKKFIFISSVAVYQDQGLSPFSSGWREDDLIQENNLQGPYEFTKIMSEKLVLSGGAHSAILRCSSLLGFLNDKDKDTNLVKLVRDKNPSLSVNLDSTYNCVTYLQVKEFIDLVILQDLVGVWNVAASANVQLKEYALRKGKTIYGIGHWTHNVGKVNNSKAKLVYKGFEKTSEENLDSLIAEG